MVTVFIYNGITIFSYNSKQSLLNKVIRTRRNGWVTNLDDFWVKTS